MEEEEEEEEQQQQQQQQADAYDEANHNQIDACSLDEQRGDSEMGGEVRAAQDGHNPCDGGAVSCPICGVLLPAHDNEKLNAHIDACLNQAPLQHARAHPPNPPDSASGSRSKRKLGGGQEGASRAASPSVQRQRQRSFLSSWVSRG